MVLNNKAKTSSHLLCTRHQQSTACARFRTCIVDGILEAIMEGLLNSGGMNRQRKKAGERLEAGKWIPYGRWRRLLHLSLAVGGR